MSYDQKVLKKQENVLKVFQIKTTKNEYFTFRRELFES